MGRFLTYRFLLSGACEPMIFSLIIIIIVKSILFLSACYYHSWRGIDPVVQRAHGINHGHDCGGHWGEKRHWEVGGCGGGTGSGSPRTLTRSVSSSSSWTCENPPHPGWFSRHVILLDWQKDTCNLLLENYFFPRQFVFPTRKLYQFGYTHDYFCDGKN